VVCRGDPLGHEVVAGAEFRALSRRRCRSAMGPFRWWYMGFRWLCRIFLPFSEMRLWLCGPGASAKPPPSHPKIR
jgi:hypothetical protein